MSDPLRLAYDRALAYVDGAGPMDGHVSDFWAEILAGRANYPSFDEMLALRRGHTYPLGERRDVDDEAAEREYAEAAQFVATRSLPPDFLAGIEEPEFGSPLRFPFDGHELSANCLVNAITAHGVLEACRRSGIAGRPLRILEIGAGFGQAARLLIERLDVAAYAVCDLPENLFLSSFYLQALFPERSVSFGGGAAELEFVVPPHAESLDGPFDLVLNSYSFQEMNRVSVEGYFALAARLLAPDGVLYSLNAHGKDEIQWPSDYPTAGFRLDRIRSPRRFAFHWNATIPYELVLRPGGGDDLGAALDGLGCAFQLGLAEQLSPLGDRVVSGGGREDVEHLAGVFRARGADEKRRHAEALRPLPVGAFLAGCLAYTAGDRDAPGLLRETLPGLGESFARVHAEMMLGNTERATELAPHLAAQLEAIAPDRAAYAGHLASCLHLQARAPSFASRLRRIGP